MLIHRLAKDRNKSTPCLYQYPFAGMKTVSWSAIESDSQFLSRLLSSTNEVFVVVVVVVVLVVAVLVVVVAIPLRLVGMVVLVLIRVMIHIVLVRGLQWQWQPWLSVHPIESVVEQCVMQCL